MEIALNPAVPNDTSVTRSETGVKENAEMFAKRMVGWTTVESLWGHQTHLDGWDDVVAHEMKDGERLGNMVTSVSRGMSDGVP